MKINNVFIWNLYKVEITNHKPIFVCASSFIGAVKRTMSLIKSWDTKECHSILQLTYVDTCLN